MVVTDSEEIPEDFPLLDFAMMMGEFGRIDSANYQRIREEAFPKRKDEENANNSILSRPRMMRSPPKRMWTLKR